MTYRYSIFKTNQPDHFGKIITRGPDGKLTSKPAGEMVRGHTDVLTVNGPHEFACWLPTVSHNQAMSTSIPANGITSALIVTKKERVNNPDALSRSKNCMEFPDGRSLITLDYDPPKDGSTPKSRDELWSLLCDLVPGVDRAPVVWWCSASSFIYDGDELVKGMSGQRLWLFVKNGRDTQRFMDELSARCWIAGLGRIEISSSGSMLKRDLFDRAMANVSRLDFVGGAIVNGTLRQQRPDPVVLSDGPPLDTEIALPSLTAAKRAEVEAIIASAESAAEPEAAATRAAWLATHERDAMRKAVDEGKDPQQARQAVTRKYEAAQKGTLSGDFVVTVVDEDGLY